MNQTRARWLRLAGLVVLLGGLAFVLVYASGRTSSPRPGSLPPATLPGTAEPIYSYAGVDPALIPALEAAPQPGQPNAPGFLVKDIPPLGMYLPATGDTQFALPTLTPVPTPTATRPPRVTLTPTRSPEETGDTAEPETEPTDTTEPPTVTPTETPTSLAPPTFTPWINTPPAECAPAGWPVGGVLTQYYAWYHRGIDLGIPSGTTVVATHSGTVKFAGWRTDGYGYLVIVESGQFITYYAHLSSYTVAQGQLINRGEPIGLAGSTGNSSGPHVHYEIRINDGEVDPLTFEKRGYGGC